MTRPDFEDAKATALAWERTSNLARAYLALLEAVAPLLVAAEEASPGPWEAGADVHNPTGIVAGRDSEGAFLYVAWADGQTRTEERANAAFIASARNTAAALRDLLAGAL